MTLISTNFIWYSKRDMDCWWHERFIIKELNLEEVIIKNYWGACFIFLFSFYLLKIRHSLGFGFLAPCLDMCPKILEYWKLILRTAFINTYRPGSTQTALAGSGPREYFFPPILSFEFVMNLRSWYIVLIKVCFFVVVLIWMTFLTSKKSFKIYET